MSRLKNLVTVRNLHLDKWSSYWFDKSFYTVLIHQDLSLRSFFSGIFTYLQIPTNSFVFKRQKNKLIFKFDLFFLQNFNKSNLNIFFSEQGFFLNYLMKKNYFLTDYLFDVIYFIRFSRKKKRVFSNNRIGKYRHNLFFFFL